MNSELQFDTGKENLNFTSGILTSMVIPKKSNASEFVGNLICTL